MRILIITLFAFLINIGIPDRHLFGQNYTQLGLAIDGKTSGENSGYSVSISSDGQVVAIGAPEYAGTGIQYGAVRVYAWNGTAWSQRGADFNGGVNGDRYGESVSLSSNGNVLAIGIPGANFDRGHVKIYDWSGTAWVQRGPTIEGDDTRDGLSQTISLSSDGNVVAIGSPSFHLRDPMNGNLLNSEIGRAKVFAWNGTAWVLRGTIIGEDTGDHCGKSVSLSSDGTVVAVSSPDYGTVGLGGNPGAVRVYTWNGTSWNQRGTRILGEENASRGGHSISLSSAGDVVAIGAPWNFGSGTRRGSVQVHAWNGSAWVKRGGDLDGNADDDWFGWSVSLASCGDVVAIGAYPENKISTVPGYAKVFSWDGSSWTQLGTDINGAANGDASGWSVALTATTTGSTVAIGAKRNGSGNEGHVRVYSGPGGGTGTGCSGGGGGGGGTGGGTGVMDIDTLSFVDPLLGETDTLYTGYDDANADTLTVHVCMSAPMGIPNSENFDLDIFENGTTQLFHGDTSNIYNGDIVLVDSVFTTDGGLTFTDTFSLGAEKCWEVTFLFDGDGNNGFEGTGGTNMNYIVAKPRMLECPTPGNLTLNETTTTSFKSSWVVTGGTTGHKFKAVLYQGDMLTKMDLGNSRPDTSTNFVRSWLWDANELTVTDSLYSYTVEGLIPCTSYQFWVAQICDGMGTQSDTSWVGAEIKTFGEEVVISAADVTDEECGLNKGSVSFDITGGPCGARQVDVLLVMTGDTIIGIDTASWFSWTDPDSSGFSLNDGVVTYGSPTDSLAAGDYTATLTVRDTFGSTYTEEVNFTVDLVDNTMPTASLYIDDQQVGACFMVSTAGDVTECSIKRDARLSLDLLTDIIDLDTLTAVTGSCGIDLDFLLDELTDNCTLSQDIEVSVVSLSGNNVSGVVYPGQDSSSRTVHVQLGAGDFNFEIQLNDKQTNPGENVNKFTFTGTVLDQTAPVVTLPGNNVYQIAECATTTDVFFTIQANDACDDAVDVSAAVTVSDGLTATYVSNGMFQIADVAAGTYTVTVSGVADAVGNTAADATFSIIVNASGAIVPRQIVGAGDLTVTLPACTDEADIHFDLFIVDECVESTGFADVVATGGYEVTGDRSGNSFSIAGVGPNETITVTATSGTASYSFDITTQKAIENGAPDITLPGNLTFTLPACDASTEVNLAIHVDDDCADLGELADNTVVTLDGATLTPNIDLSGSENGQAVLTFTVEISSADNGAELKVTSTDGSQSSTAQSKITVLQNAIATEYACEDNVIIRLDADGCEAAVTPAMVLKGDESTICNDLLQVIVEKFDAAGNFDGYEKDHVTGVGTRRYMVYSSALDIPASAYSKTSTFFVNRNDMICWGTLTTEDKTLPTLECTDDTDVATMPAAYVDWVGTLDVTSDKKFQPQNFTCYQSTWGPDGGTAEQPPVLFYPYDNPLADHYFDTWTFKPAQAGKYTIHLITDRDFDGMMSIFQQPGVYDPDLYNRTTGAELDGYPRSQADKDDEGTGWFNHNEPCANVVAFGETIAQVVGGIADDNYEYQSIYFDRTETSGVGAGAEVVQRISLPISNINKEMTIMVTSRGTISSNQTFIVRVEYETDNGALAATSTSSIVSYWNPSAPSYNNEVAGWKAYTPTVGAVTIPLYCDDYADVLISPATILCYVIKDDYTNPSWNLTTGGINMNDVTSWKSNGAALNATNAASMARKLLVTGSFPDVGDNCGPVTVCVQDVLTQTGNGCGETYITRTFTATDNYGNKAVGEGANKCTQRIDFAVPSIRNLNLPHYTAYLECDEAFATDASGNPSPAVTGYPFMRSAFGYHDLAEEWCNLAATYNDEAKIETCGDGYKLRREWTILDWCRPGLSVVYNQLIKVGDFTAPVIDAAGVIANNGVQGLEKYNDVLTYSVSPFDCYASFRVPVPGVYEVCSDYTVTFKVIEKVLVPVKDHFNNIVAYDEDKRTIREGKAGDMVTGIAQGKDIYYYEFTATDECGNASKATVDFNVFDLIEPASICDDEITVTLGGGTYAIDNNNQPVGGSARLHKEDLAEGLWDNCGGVLEYQVRHEGTTSWGNYVDFTCADLGEVNKVELQVTDEAGNTSLCWVLVTVEDKTLPYCIAPDDFEGLCTDLPADFNPPATLADYKLLSGPAKEALHEQLNDLFGAPEVLDNCTGTVSITQTVTKIDWHCNSGEIVRTFEGTDAAGNETYGLCDQVITISLVHDYSFTLPADQINVSCGNPAEPFDIAPEVSGCDLISVYVDSERRFETNDEDCYKIFRTYEVVNWCQFTGDDLSVHDPFHIDRDWVTTQDPVTGKYSVKDNFVVSYKDIEANDVWTKYILVGTAADEDKYHNEVVSGGEGETYAPGYYSYTQVIAVYDNVAPTVSADLAADYCSFDVCGAGTSVVIPITVADNCGDELVTVTAHILPGDGSAAVVATVTNNASVSASKLTLGEHTLVVTATDGCGNSNEIRETIKVVDCKGPGITCRYGIAVELMPVDDNGDGSIDGGAMTVFAKDYVSIFDEDPCDPAKYFTIHRRTNELDAELAAHEAKPANERSRTLRDVLDSNTANESMVVTCDDRPLTEVIIAAWDANGNGDYCTTHIMVQDNMNLCDDPGPSVAGLISTETNNTVENVEVNLSGQMTDNMLTTTDGNYAFVNLQSGYDYTITPLLDDDHDNGVTTFDLIEIGKHILTVKPLGSPYKMIAADVDNNRSITTLDLIQLRRLILSVDREFANNTSWRFVDASYQFQNPSNPWATDFPEIININDLDGSELSGDFVAIKVGDVTLDARANSLMSGSRSTAGTFTLETADIEMKAGGEYTVSFTASNLADIQGYQFTLNLDESVELTEITYGIASAEHFGTTHLAEGALTTSWNAAALAPPAAPAPGEIARPVQTRFIASPTSQSTLFAITLHPSTDLTLSQALTLNSRYTLAEAYNQKGQPLAVALNFKTGETAAAIELYQNTPNPFKGETVLGFNLPEAASATLTVTDVTGKVLRIIKGEYARGYNQISLNSAQLPATGVLYYTLETGDFTATKKMVVVP